MSSFYPRLGGHSVLVELPPLAEPYERWRAIVRVTVRNGRLVEWHPEAFAYLGEETDCRYSPKSLEGPLPHLVERLCAHAELWFQAERDRISKDREQE